MPRHTGQVMPGREVGSVESAVALLLDCPFGNELRIACESIPRRDAKIRTRMPSDFDEVRQTWSCPPYDRHAAGPSDSRHGAPGAAGACGAVGGCTYGSP